MARTLVNKKTATSSGPIKMPLVPIGYRDVAPSPNGTGVVASRDTGPMSGGAGAFPGLSDTTAKDFLAGSGPSYKASEGGAETILLNIAKTAGNMPSSARNLVKTAIAPVNPLDTQNPLNIGKNAVDSAVAVKDIFSEQGAGEGIKNIASGFLDTAKKIFEAPGKAYMNYLQKTGYADNPDTKHLFETTVLKPLEAVAKIGIEDPLLIPSLLYGGGEAKGSEDLISKVASPVTRGADTSLPSVAAKAGEVGNVAKKAVSGVIEKMTPAEKTIDDYVTKTFEKAIKPSVTGRKTPAQVNTYNEKSVQAVKTIAENKDNLKFVTEGGDEIGRLPQTLREFGESVEQTKKSIYDQYNNLAIEANGAGVKIDLAPVSEQLDAVINNKALAISHPESVGYAKKVQNRLADSGSLDVKTTQELVENYNNSLKSFYQNPTYDTASRAAVDAGVVRAIRKSLDDAIEGATGKEYQALKDKYGALKTIEQDVVHRANIEARKQTKGLIDYADIFSGGDIAAGILTLNPALFAKGVAQKSIKEYFKMLNDPNRAIKKMFEKAISE